jgi:subfamily B ATP-binding cassette protein MsbA
MAIERVFEMIDMKVQIQENKKAKEMPALKNEIEFKNVDFSYTEEKQILKNINLTIKKGETVALVGNSGGGKTTVVNLIPRFYDVNSGEILIDGLNVKDISLSSLRDQIAVVFQDNFLFSGTIKDNIMLGKPTATKKEVEKAIKMACLDEFINSLENGLDTEIGERGVLLSGGQKQRIAIARAFLKNAPIVILDEATSALDNKSEAIVQQAIDNLMKDRTVIVIAHRLSTVQNADEICVLDQGEIVERGTHAELMQLENGIYKKLQQSQLLH